MGCLAFHKKATRHSLLNPLQVVNYLRYGCTPVGVTEGRPPAEKLERLQQRCFVQNLLAAETPLCQCSYSAARRFRARTGRVGGGGGNHYFAKMGKSVADLLHNMVRIPAIV